MGIFILTKVNAQQNKSLSDFTQVEAGQVFDIQLFTADRHSIYIEPPYENDVMAEVSNGVLHLSASKKGTGVIKVKLYFKELKGVQLSGAAGVSNNDTLISPQFSIHTSGAAKVKMILKSDIIKVDADGASDVIISGTGATTNFILSGASELKAYDLTAQKVTIQTSGAANAKLNVTEFLSAHAEGASHISFSGKPAYKNISINGVATIKDKTEGDDFNNEIVPGLNKDGDTTRLKIGKKKFMIIDDDKKEEYIEGLDESPKHSRRKMKHVWTGFELGVNGLVTPQMNFSFSDNYKFLDSKIGESWFFGLNLPEIDGQIIRNKLAITTGFGLQWSNIHFNGNDVLIPHIDSLAATKSPANSNLSLNKLYTFDLTAPLLIKFAPGTGKKANGGFHLAAGVIFHYVATAGVVTETSENGYLLHTEFRDNFNINPFRVDATVRLGYDRIKLFANYSLTPYFDSSKAPDVRAFAAGLTLIGF